MGGVLCLTFPYYQDVPADLAEGFDVFAVAGASGSALILPELGVCFWDDFAISTVVHVPETAVDEDDFVQSGEDHVGSAGEVLAVKAESETHTVNQRPYQHFRFSVLAAYP